MRLAVAAGVAGLAMGGFLGYRLAAPKVAPEPPAPALRQADGSLVLQRAPDAPAKPAHALPAGHKPVRVVNVTVQPKSPECPPVTIDMTLARAPDGSHRVIASSPDGAVVGGLDVPLGSSVVAQRQWAAGISYEPSRQLKGAWAHRDYGRIRTGVEVSETRSRDIEARVLLGFTF